MPVVSVVTALYNHKPYLAERVRSILNQTLDDLEWIVVDDCSTDGSYDEILRLTAADRRVRVLRNPSNQGHMRTNQRALDQARGTYVYRVDSDDSCDPRFLEIMVKVLNDNPAAGFAHCRGLRMDARNGVWGGIPRRSGRYLKAPSAFPELVLDYTIKAPALLFRHSAIDKIGAFDLLPPGANFEWNADWHFSLRMALVSDLVFHPEPLAYYRLHGTNLSRSSKLNLHNLELLEHIFDHLPEHHRHFETLRSEAYRRTAANLFVGATAARDGGFEKEFHETMALIRKYVPDFEPPRAMPMKGLMERAALAAVKLLTYRVLAPE